MGGYQLGSHLSQWRWARGGRATTPTRHPKMLGGRPRPTTPTISRGGQATPFLFSIFLNNNNNNFFKFSLFIFFYYDRHLIGAYVAPNRSCQNFNRI